MRGGVLPDNSKPSTDRLAWWLEGARPNVRSLADDGRCPEPRDILRLGAAAIDVADIVSYRIDEIADRDPVSAGTLVTIGAAALALAIAGFSALMASSGLDSGILLAAALGLGGIGALAEMTGATKRQRLRLAVFTRHGAAHALAFADAAELGRLADFLATRLRGPVHEPARATRERAVGAGGRND